MHYVLSLDLDSQALISTFTRVVQQEHCRFQFIFTLLKTSTSPLTLLGQQWYRKKKRKTDVPTLALPWIESGNGLNVKTSVFNSLNGSFS